MAREHVIELDDVSFAYDGRPVLEHVTLEVHRHELTSIVGPNGGGKTTLLRLILGLVRPGTGTVRVFGASPRRARRRIGYMPQHARHDPQFPVTAMDVVLMGRLERRLCGPYAQSDREAALAALEEMRLAEAADRPLDALSGGERQRVLIARALACEPDLLLLDEPTASVDVAIEEQFHDILERLNDRLTIVMVSHDLRFVSRIVQHVICVNRTVTSHPTDEFSNEVIKDLYGGDLRLVRHDRRCRAGGGDHE